MIKGNSKDKELKMEINTKLSKEHFFLFCRKNWKYKSNIIGTPGLPAWRSPRPNSRGATFSIYLLTCIESRIMLTVLKFKVLDPFLQRSSGGISHLHLTHLKKKSAKTSVIHYEVKSKQKILKKHHLIPSSLHWLHIGNTECEPIVAASDHLHTFLHKININLKHKSTRSWAIQ